eukprot:1810442-Prymnesium_polylepis.1
MHCAARGLVADPLRKQAVHLRLRGVRLGVLLLTPLAEGPALGLSKAAACGGGGHTTPWPGLASLRRAVCREQPSGRVLAGRTLSSVRKARRSSATY